MISKLLGSFFMLSVLIFLGVLGGSNFVKAASTFESQTNLTGVITDVNVNQADELLGFSLVDANGVSYMIDVLDDSEFGLEDRAGSLWNAKLSEGKVEAGKRFLDQQRRFAPITAVVSPEGVALSVTDAAPRNLDSNLSFVGAAYIVLWLAVFVYLFIIHRKQSRLKKKLDILEQEKG